MRKIGGRIMTGLVSVWVLICITFTLGFAATQLPEDQGGWVQSFSTTVSQGTLKTVNEVIDRQTYPMHIVFIDSFGNTAPSTYAKALYKQWTVRNSLLVFGLKDHKYWVLVEKRLVDRGVDAQVVSQQIRSEFSPLAKSGKYGEATIALVQAVNQAAKPAQTAPSNNQAPTENYTPQNPTPNTSNTPPSVSRDDKGGTLIAAVLAGLAFLGMLGILIGGNRARRAKAIRLTEQAWQLLGEVSGTILELDKEKGFLELYQGKSLELARATLQQANAALIQFRPAQEQADVAKTLLANKRYSQAAAAAQKAIQLLEPVRQVCQQAKDGINRLDQVEVELKQEEQASRSLIEQTRALVDGVGMRYSYPLEAARTLLETEVENLNKISLDAALSNDPVGREAEVHRVLASLQGLKDGLDRFEECHKTLQADGATQGKLQARVADMRSSGYLLSEGNLDGLLQQSQGLLSALPGLLRKGAVEPVNQSLKDIAELQHKIPVMLDATEKARVENTPGIDKLVGDAKTLHYQLNTLLQMISTEFVPYSFGTEPQAGKDAVQVLEGILQEAPTLTARTSEAGQEYLAVAERIKGRQVEIGRCTTTRETLQSAMANARSAIREAADLSGGSQATIAYCNDVLHQAGIQTPTAELGTWLWQIQQNSAELTRLATTSPIDLPVLKDLSVKTREIVGRVRKAAEELAQQAARARALMQEAEQKYQRSQQAMGRFGYNGQWEDMRNRATGSMNALDFAQVVILAGAMSSMADQAHQRWQSEVAWQDNQQNNSNNSGIDFGGFGDSGGGGFGDSGGGDIGDSGGGDW